MGLTRYISILACTLMAAIGTACAYFIDIHYSRRGDEAEYLSIARQMASQAEGMAYAARLNQELDPIGWAVRLMSQGDERRLIRIAKIHAMPEQGMEKSGFAAGNVFEYTKILAPEDGSGVKVKIVTRQSGFLGARSAFSADALLALVFLISFAVAFALYRKYIQMHPAGMSEEDIIERLAGARLIGPEQNAPQPLLQTPPDLQHLVPELVALGRSVSAMIGASRDLARSALASRECQLEISANIEGAAPAARQAAEALALAARVAAEARTRALNIMIESSRMGEEGVALRENAGTLRSAAQKIQDLMASAGQALSGADANLGGAHQAADRLAVLFEEVSAALGGINAGGAGTADRLRAHIAAFRGAGRKAA